MPAIKCNIDQVERLAPVVMDVAAARRRPASTADGGPADGEVPLPRAFPLAGGPGVAVGLGMVADTGPS